MSTSPRSITLNPGCKGFVVGVVNAAFKQRVFLDVRNTTNEQVTSATFEGQGTRVHLKNTFNNREHWSFGPFSYTATVLVTISHQQGSGSQYHVSKMVGPLSVKKNPETDYPIEFDISTVVSEDRADQSHDDCTVTVLQYKQ